MNKLILPIAIATAAMAASAALAATQLPTVATSPAFSGRQFASRAKISLAQARTAALKARSGTITDEELETEGGGSGLRYSFDIKSHGVTYEVGVDAVSGKVLENGREGKNPD